MNIPLARYVFDPLLAAAAFALMAATAWLLGSALGRSGAVFANIISPPSAKVATLEGIRGVLASSVAFHHAYCWFFFASMGIWTTGQSVVFRRLATFGVLQFFYLSGYLFWRKLLKGTSASAPRFYLSRFLRIGPVYYVCIGSAILIGLFRTGSTPGVQFANLTLPLLTWFTFTMAGQPSFNSADIARITCGVTWTLAMEWMFYILLPALSWFSKARLRLMSLAFALASLVAATKYFTDRVGATSIDPTALLWLEFPKFMLIGFGGGILLATYEPVIRNWTRKLGRWANWILLIVYVVYLISPGAEFIVQPLLLAGFSLVIAGTDLFGFITSIPVRLLGRISFPLYLIHGIVYYIAFGIITRGRPAVALTYIPMTAMCLVLIVLLSALVHAGVERYAAKVSENIVHSVPRPALPQEAA